MLALKEAVPIKDLNLREPQSLHCVPIRNGPCEIHFGQGGLGESPRNVKALSDLGTLLEIQEALYEMNALHRGQTFSIVVLMELKVNSLLLMELGDASVNPILVVAFDRNVLLYDLYS